MKRWKSTILVGLVGAGLALPLLADTPAPQSLAAVQYAAIPSGDYTIDPMHSIIGFSIRHLEINWVEGRFKDFTGTIHYDAADVSRSSVDFNAKTESIDTGVVPRDKDLRSANFFDVAKYPEMSFQSTRVERRGNGYLLVGDLTMKGVTHSLELPFTMTGAVTDPRGNLRIGIDASTKIKRSDFGVGGPAPLAGGGASIGDEVSIRLQLEAIRKK